MSRNKIGGWTRLLPCALGDQVRDERANLVIGRAPDQGFVHGGDFSGRPAAYTDSDFHGPR